MSYFPAWVCLSDLFVFTGHPLHAGNSLLTSLPGLGKPIWNHVGSVPLEP